MQFVIANTDIHTQTPTKLWSTGGVSRVLLFLGTALFVHFPILFLG